MLLPEDSVRWLPTAAISAGGETNKQTNKTIEKPLWNVQLEKPHAEKTNIQLTAACSWLWKLEKREKYLKNITWIMKTSFEEISCSNFGRAALSENVFPSVYSNFAE